MAVEAVRPEGRFSIRLLPALREAGVVCFFAGLAVLFTWPLAADLWGRTLSGPDPMHHMWSIHWTSGHLLDPGRFFHGNIYHPSPFSVLYIDLDLGSVVLVAPFRPWLKDPVPLFNLAVLLALAFSGWAFCALVRDLTGQPWAGLMSGILAAFSSHQMTHVYHLNLLSLGWMPLFWLGLRRLLRRPGWGSAVLAGVSFSLTAQSSGYYAVIAAVVAIVFGIWHWRRLALGQGLTHLAAAVSIAVSLTAPYLWGFMQLRQHAGIARDLELSEQMAFHPRQDLGSRSYLYRGLVGTGGQRLFPGLLAPILALVALARRRPHSGLYLATFLTLLALSFGPRLELGGWSCPLPYRALFAIPPLDSMRHPYTFAAVAGFALAVLAGLGSAALAGPRRRWLGPLAVAAALAETLGPAPKTRSVDPGLPPVYELLRSVPPGPVLDINPRPHTMVWAARYGGPVIHGAGPFGPPDHLALRRQIRNHWLRRVPKDVDSSKPVELLRERIPVRYLIVPVGQLPALWRLGESMTASRLFRLVAEASDGDLLFEFQAHRGSPERRPDSGAGAPQPLALAHTRRMERVPPASAREETRRSTRASAQAGHRRRHS